MSKHPGLKKIFTIRVYAQLNDFLPLERRQRAFQASFKTPTTVQEIILALGIPLAEVNLVLVNNERTPLSHFPKEHDRIAIYPEFALLDIPPNANKSSISETRFILDAHLGKLAKYLRMLGFDTLYSNHFKDNEIISLAETSHHIILTRDKSLLTSSKIKRGCYVRAIHPHEQLKEIVRRFDLTKQFKSFTRCMTCNAPLSKVDKNSILSKIPTEVASVFNDFYYCRTCDKVFWKGSHFRRMEQYIRELANS